MASNGWVLLSLVLLTLEPATRPVQLAPRSQQIEAYFDALAKTAFGSTYADDGASDGTVTESGKVIESGALVRPLEAVKE